jgi:hypothetical protein
LRSHDERLVEQLASRTLTSGKRKIHIRRDEDGQIVGAGGEGQKEDTQADAEAALLHFSSPRDAATIAAAASMALPAHNCMDGQNRSAQLDRSDAP